jgi:hypothetical protein
MVVMFEMKGKPWTVEEEKQLRELVGQGKSINVISGVLGKSKDSIRVKLNRLGIEVVDHTVSARSTTSRLNIPGDLPSVEEALQTLCKTLDALDMPGLDQTEVLRLRTIIQGIKIYKELFADYINYREIEEKVAEMEEAYERLAATTKSLAKKQPAQVVQASKQQTTD